MTTTYTDLCRLTPWQLVAITLRDDDAASTLRQFGNLRALEEATVDEMSSMGLTREHAEALKAAIELGRRCINSPNPKTRIGSPGDVFDLLGAEMAALDREQIRVIMLDTRNGIIDVETVAIGSLSSCVGHPREIFKGAVMKSAAAIILTHNHPSGDSAPSPEDIALTRRMLEAGKLLGIDLLDHVVIGDGSYCSIRSLISQAE